MPPQPWVSGTWGSEEPTCLTTAASISTLASPSAASAAARSFRTRTGAGPSAQPTATCSRTIFAALVTRILGLPGRPSCTRPMARPRCRSSPWISLSCQGSTTHNTFATEFVQTTGLSPSSSIRTLLATAHNSARKLFFPTIHKSALVRPVEELLLCKNR